MFYLSKHEQVALFLLVALLLSGAGVLTYQRGVQAGRARSPEPLFTEAKSAATPLPAAATAPTEEMARVPDSDYPPPVPNPVARPSAHPRVALPEKEAAGPRVISLSRATAEDLEALPGIGPVLAGRIVQYRDRLKKESGRGFASVDELLNVPGIGPKRLAAIRDQVVP